MEELCEHLPGPDYPTEAEIITPRDELQRNYLTGGGSVRMRARYEREQGDIVITALPHQVSVRRYWNRLPPKCRPKTADGGGSAG